MRTTIPGQRAMVANLILCALAIIPALAQTPTAPAEATPAAAGAIWTYDQTWGISNGQYVNLGNNPTSSPITTAAIGAIPTESVSPSSISSQSSQAASSSAASSSSASIVGGAPSPSSTSSSLSPTASVANSTEPNYYENATTWNRFDKIVTAHAVVGSLAWMIMSPLAILIAGITKTKGWKKIHAAIQIIVVAKLTLVAFITGVVATAVNNDSHFASAHQRIGLVLLILVLLQTFLGHFVLERYNKDGYRSTGHIIHAVLGVTLTALGFVQVYLGVQLFSKKAGRTAPLVVVIIWGIIVGLVSLYLIFLTLRVLWKDRQDSPERSTKRDSRWTWENLARRGRDQDLVSVASNDSITGGFVAQDMAQREASIGSPAIRHSAVPISSPIIPPNFAASTNERRPSEIQQDPFVDPPSQQMAAARNPFTDDAAPFSHSLTPRTVDVAPPQRSLKLPIVHKSPLAKYTEGQEGESSQPYNPAAAGSNSSDLLSGQSLGLRRGSSPLTELGRRTSQDTGRGSPTSTKTVRRKAVPGP